MLARTWSMTPKRRELLRLMADHGGWRTAGQWGALVYAKGHVRLPQHYARPATVALRYMQSLGYVVLHHREHTWAITHAGVRAAQAGTVAR